MELKKHLEGLLIAFCIIAILLLHWNVDFSPLLIIIALALLSFYYLLSGTLVLFNKQVLQGIRLIYFIGLWSISIGLIGVTYKLRFWFNSELLLLLGIFFCLAVLVFILIYIITTRKNIRSNINHQMKPVLVRLLLYPLLFFGFYFVPNYHLYQVMGEHRDDALYVRYFLEHLENPGDQLAQEQLRDYERIKFGPNR